MLAQYSSYRDTQDPIMPDQIKRSFSVVYHNHKWYSDITEFTLNEQKTYLSSIIGGCTLLNWNLKNLSLVLTVVKFFSIVLFETDEAWALLVTFLTTLRKLKKAL